MFGAWGDYFSSGSRASLRWLQARLLEVYDIKNYVGPGTNEHLEGNILNRVVRYTEQGFELACDPRHVELIAE